MKFSDIVSIVTIFRTPVDEELVLANPVLDPVEAHVDGFSGLVLDTVVGEANRSGVVNLDGGCWLWVVHFGEGDTEG